MARIPPRLASFLGTELSQIDETALRTLIGLRESDDLEAKSAVYESKDKAKRELALDVASMANDKGGLIVIGAVEENEVITAITGVELPDGETLRIRQIISERVVPHLPCEIHLVEIEGSKTAVIIAVDPSPRAPHAVRENETLRYAIRDNERKRTMSEAEVASHYRRRFDGSASRIQRLSELHDSHPDLRLPASTAQLVVASVPDIPGRLRINTETKQQFQDELNLLGTSMPAQPGNIAAIRHVSTRVRRFIASDRSEEHEPRYSRSVIEAHTDGSTLSAFTVGSEVKVRADRFREDDGGAAELLVSEEQLSFALLEALHFSGWHARRTAASGDLNLMCAVVSIPEQGLDPVDMLLGHYRRQFGASSSTPRKLHETERAAHAIPIASASTIGTELAASTSIVGADLVAAFGLPQLPQINEQGDLRLPYIARNWRQYIVPWAEQYGLKVLDEV